jgi:hypothetical protein
VVIHEHVGPLFSHIGLFAVTAPSMWMNAFRFDTNLVWMFFSDIVVLYISSHKQELAD